MNQPKLKNKAFIIDLHIYPCKVFVVVGDIKQLRKLLLDYKKPPTEEQLKQVFNDLDYNLDGYSGLSYQLKYSGNFVIYIAKDVNVFDIIPHEVMHTVQDIFSHIGEHNLSEDNTEAYCYLNGYINKEIFKQL